MEPIRVLTASDACAIPASLAFIFRAQARFTARVTTYFHEEQHKKMVASQKKLYRRLGLSANAITRIIGAVNLVLVAALLRRRTRVPAAVIALPFLGLSLRGRWVIGRSTVPPIVVMTVLLGAIVL
jgi:ABC-type transporter Mla maintaining outer membrane lipid asymmetry permease subunit MlaE